MNEEKSASQPIFYQAHADRLQPRGSNHVGMRQFNERIVLQTLRLHPQLSKADVARQTRLSHQTASAIIDRLLDDGLLLRGEPLRGKVGQPSIPIVLNPEGAFSIGINLGRSRLDMVLMDFVGCVQERLTIRYKYPDPKSIFAEIARGLQQFKHSLGEHKSLRLVGVGVAAPFWLGSWSDYWGEYTTQVEDWNSINIQKSVQNLTDLPVEFSRDTAAACVAELVAGKGRSVKSFLYLYVGTFIGGGLVIDSHLHVGLRGNAGAVGSLPLGVSGVRIPQQLIEKASLSGLEKRFSACGLDETAAYDGRAMQEPWLPHTRAWITEAATAIALASATTSAILDMQGVIVDGLFDRNVLTALLQAVQGACDEYNWEGMYRPEMLSGSIGVDARATGAAFLPLYAHFAPDRDLFLKLDT